MLCSVLACRVDTDLSLFSILEESEDRYWVPGSAGTLDFARMLGAWPGQVMANRENRAEWMVETAMPLAPDDPNFLKALPGYGVLPDWEEANTAKDPQVWLMTPTPPGSTTICKYPAAHRQWLETAEACTAVCLMAMRMFRTCQKQGRPVRISSTSLGLCDIVDVRGVRGRYIAPPDTVRNPFIRYVHEAAAEGGAAGSPMAVPNNRTLIAPPLRVYDGHKEYQHEWLVVHVRPVNGGEERRVYMDACVRHFGVDKQVGVCYAERSL